MILHKFKNINATYLLISISITVFLLELFYNYFLGVEALEELVYNMGLSLENILAGKWWVLFTSIFFHANAEHLILNMIALFFFGSVLEHELGWKKVMLIYFVSAFLGEFAVLGATAIGLMPVGVPTIGASGAIFGLLGAAMLIKPLEFVFFPYLIPIPLILVALLYILLNIGEFIVIVFTGGTTDVAYMAHIGGMAAGMIFGFKHEGKKRSLIVLTFVLLMLVLIPFIWGYFQQLEMTNYASLISQLLNPKP